MLTMGRTDPISACFTIHCCHIRFFQHPATVLFNFVSHSSDFSANLIILSQFSKHLHLFFNPD